MAEEIRGPEPSAEVEDLRAQLAEAEDTLRAISDGQADALVIDVGRGDEVHFLGGGQSIYRRFIEAVSQGAATLSGDGTILSCDACLAKTLGIPLARVVGTSLADYLSPDDGEVLGAVLALSDAEPRRRKVRLTTDTGESVPVYVSASVLHGAGSQQVSCVIFTDLEEVVSAESALRDSEERYRGLVELAPVGITVLLDGKIAFANPAAWRMLGADSEQQVLGRPVEAIIHPDSLEAALSRMSRVVAGGGGLYPTQVVCLRLDGTPIDVELEATQVSFRGSAAVQVIVTDVSQRNKDARALERVTRALRTLAACNAALVHARDEESLLQAVCDIAVAEGAYWMTWVGYAERDEAKSVRPVAFAGHEDGFLSEVGFTWGDGAESSPPGLAIREHTSVLLHEIDSDTRFPIGREARIARGYRSLAALPLIDSTGDAFGALTFMAADANAFDVDELTLLEELAADLAFGIEARRTWVRRLEAEDATVRSNERLKTLFIQLTEMIGRVVEARDPYTSGHEERVAAVAVALARQMGLPQNIIDSLRVAALLHDVGKMVVPAEILTKPGKLSGVEFSLIKEHARAGYEILKDIPFDRPIAEFVLQHHERMDGSGYPAGLQGDEIHVESRILAVADVIEAMASHRPYRAALGLEAAVAEIVGSSGKYDPAVAAACKALYDDGRLNMEASEPGAASPVAAQYSR